MTLPRPLYRRPPEERRQEALRHLGRPVTVMVDACRDGTPTPLAGVLIAVASPTSGTVADLAIIRRGPSALGDVAVSLATIYAITESHLPKAVAE